MSVDRVQKILARSGVAARRKAENLIREGRVTVNGKVVALGEKADPEKDTIKVDGKRIQRVREHRYLLMNKPKGVLTAVSDDSGRTTVVDLVPPTMRTALVPVGRLDFHTEGLLILTDDGDLAQRLSPVVRCVHLLQPVPTLILTGEFLLIPLWRTLAPVPRLTWWYLQGR